MGLFNIECKCGNGYLWHSSSWIMLCSECRKSATFECTQCGIEQTCDNSGSLFGRCFDCSGDAKMFMVTTVLKTEFYKDSKEVYTWNTSK